MVRIPSYRRLVSLLCAALFAGLLLLGAAVARAGLTEGLPGATAEVTNGVEEVTNGVVPPVQKTVETVAPPAGEVTGSVVPPVVETTETGTRVVQEATTSVPMPAPPVSTPTPKVPAVPPVHLPAGGGGSGTAGETEAVVTETVEKVTHAVRETVGRAAAPVRTASAAASNVVPEPGTESAARHAAGTEAARPAAAEDAPGPGVQSTGVRSSDGNRFRAPSTDGSVRAPVPKWVAYVWPAIALTRPDVTSLLRRWKGDAPRILLSIAAGASAGQGIAGVHAAHGGRTGAGGRSDRSSSAFPDISSAVAGVAAHLPEEALAYLVLVALLIAVVFAAVKYEMVRARR